ncbi:MAG: hypothetical protein KF696_14435 [Planctomycetes bacterium]|nr:hypothetical protein [Planctomycetota bacterium]MCW8136808.1 hypothetical protein [Planctomycetota bacterium]
MSLLDRIKNMIKGQAGEAEQVIRDASSTREMLEHLDELITQNEVELRKTRQELARLELSERASIENIKSGRVGEREKEFVLLQIKRTRGQMESLKLKADILNKNIELHLNLVGKIQAMEAMDLRGIEQNVVERVMLDFEEGMEKYREAVHAGEGVTTKKEDVLSARDKEDLRKLEKEILGEKPATRKVDMDQELADIEAELMQAERERKEAAKDMEQELE